MTNTESSTSDDRLAEDENGRYPVTVALAVSWVLVYAAMALHQGVLHANAGNWLAGGIKPSTAYLFGSMTSADVARGQVWRVLTATFVHFSIIHLAINTIVLYQLGRVVEPWYGSAQFLTLYVVVGGSSNALAAVLRPMLARPGVLHLQSGGGSGFICGLIGLIAVVGWRSRSRLGQYMLKQMAFQLVFLGIFGMVVANVDNLVHAAGAIVGGLAGLFDSLLMRRPRRFAWSAGVASLVLLVASALAQARGDALDRNERDRCVRIGEAVEKQIQSLKALEGIYLDLASSLMPASYVEPVFALKKHLIEKRLFVSLGRATLEFDLETQILQSSGFDRTWRKLVEFVVRKRPDPAQIVQFRDLNHRLIGRAQERLDEIVQSLRLWNSKLGPLKLPEQHPVNAPQEPAHKAA